MAEPKFTKWPWKFQKDQYGDKRIVDSTDRTLMCDTDYYPWIALEDAEWALVAAAPQLYEACKAAIRVMEDQPYSCFDEPVDIIRTAIAAAEGEQ